jgi:hypothetical protein
MPSISVVRNRSSSRVRRKLTGSYTSTNEACLCTEIGTLYRSEGRISFGLESLEYGAVTGIYM